MALLGNPSEARKEDMNKREADDIAWRLSNIESARMATGPDCAMEVANSAIDAVARICEKHPKIADAMEDYKPNDLNEHSNEAERQNQREDAKKKG